MVDETPPAPPESPAAPAAPAGHKIELSKSGRAACRSCGQAIAKGVFRFGEEMPNPFAEAGGASYRWHHMACAAKERPAQLKQALTTFEGDLPERESLLATLATWEDDQRAKNKPTGLPYAERAKNDRSRCRVCRETIDKGALRVAVERPLEQRSYGMNNVGYLHLACTANYPHGVPPLDAVLEHSTALAADDLAEVRTALGG